MSINCQVDIDFDLLALPGKKLGGGFKGFMPRGLITSNKTDSFAIERFALKHGWNTRWYSGPGGLTGAAVTPFRAVNNAGDRLSRLNYSCGGVCQTPQSRPGLYGLRQKFGGINAYCKPSPISEPAACNVKYVYDGSDYTTYKRKLAMNKNYNDSSFGGDRYSAAQSKLRAIHRY